MIRPLVLVAVVLILAGCGAQDGREPFAESRPPPGLAPRFMPPPGWAWGYVRPGASPVQRYGVSSPPGATPRAEVLILPGYGESAEAWFETARDLNAAGCNVWVLERAGQGGSERYILPRDLGHVPSFEPDAAATRAMVRRVIRPDRPLVVLAAADGAPVALRAVQTGLKVDGLIFSAAKFAGPERASRPADRVLGRLGGGRLPSNGWRPWTREGPDSRSQGLTDDPVRGGIQHAWQLANPDLRMSGPSVGWLSAWRAESRSVLNEPRRVRTRVLLLHGATKAAVAARFCDRLEDCRDVTISGAPPAPHLARDAARGPWIAAIIAFIDAEVSARERDAQAPDLKNSSLKSVP